MPPSPKRRATLRSVAAAAGVSAMTVSLALRNHPRIPAETRELVQRAADQLGYRPDPQVAKLMHHLRTQRKPGYQSSIAAITTVPEGTEVPYLADIIRNARRRAEELGYGFSLFRTVETGPSPALQRVLRARGVEGVLLLPVSSPCDVTRLLQWEDFSVLTTTYGVLAPQFHRVVPHQFGNGLLICQRLAGLGYGRIGLVLPAEQDVRVHHGFSAAVAWQSLLGGTEFVRPFIHRDDGPVRDELRAWNKRERPDAIIAEGDGACRHIARQLGLRVPGRVAFVSANHAGPSVFAGIDERPEEVGSAAVELLAGMIQRGEKGVPPLAKTTMIDGQWVNGRSVPGRSVAAKSGRPAGSTRPR